jgi:N-carbamoyl-L-amino-acid hydrolase
MLQKIYFKEGNDMSIFDQIQSQLDHLNSITDHSLGKGINRLAFSDSDWKARSYIVKLMRNAGMIVHYDTFGNVIAKKTGTKPDLPVVMLGSHSDSVPNGGNFDGIVGLLTAIEAVRQLTLSNYKNDHTIVIVDFMCEESSRFGAATLGSRSMRGELSLAEIKKLSDKDGITLYEALKNRKLDPDNIEKAIYTKPVKAFLETHIEQGKLLDLNKVPIGIVSGIAAPTRFKIHLNGSADHSGATPMAIRHDGLCAAAEIILAVEKQAALYSDLQISLESVELAKPPVVGTVGICNVYPNAINVIPGRVELAVDIRSIDFNAKEVVTTSIKSRINEICTQRNIPYEIEMISIEKPVKASTKIVKFLNNICKKLDTDCIIMPSGAGHDAMHWADYTPTGMLFIPCKDGISHNADEFARTEDIVTSIKIIVEYLTEITKKDCLL